MSDFVLSRTPTVSVWDPLVRVGHWLLVLSVFLAWLTRAGGGAWHERVGYATVAIVGVRLVWGWAGSTHARFANLISGPARHAELCRADDSWS